MSKYSSLDASLAEVLTELEGELEAETEKHTFKWVVSLRRGFGEGYELVDSLSTAPEPHTKDDAVRQSAVIQKSYITLKKSGERGSMKVERFIQDGGRWIKDRSRTDDACSKADLAAPYLKITGCWP